MDAIFFMLRTECSWNALNETGIGFSRCAHCRFPEWTKTDVFVDLVGERPCCIQSLVGECLGVARD
jgi:hypothetical protein